MHRSIMFSYAWVTAVLAVSTMFTAATPIKITEIDLTLNRSMSNELRIWTYESDFVLKNIRFLLWTSQNPTEFQELEIGDVSKLTESGFNNDVPTKIFAHGFINNGYSTPIVLDMRDAYLKREDCNFIAVDWGLLAIPPFYIRSATYSTLVGEQTGNLINFLVEQGADLKDFHVIGFSLGAHVAGKAGATVNGVLPRITGLDPAYPLFSMEDTDQRLDTTDAEFVDVIHTNSGYLIQAGLSFPHPIGHVDFFPNGGMSQPGCGLLISGSIFDLMVACSHLRGSEYFTESINNPTGFTGVACESYEMFQEGGCSGNTMAVMGEAVPKTTRGAFYLNTNSRSPFAKTVSN